jgi:hypothetical protein
MFNSSVLEVAIGLIFCFASVALITSSIYEAIASWLSLRSKNLLSGIKTLLNANSPAGEELLLKVYNHGLAHPTGDGSAKSIADLRHGPSYIEPKHFALALIDAVQSTSRSYAELGADIDAISNPQIRQLLRGMYDRSSGDIEQLQTDLATWFDAGMDRVSGAYKRKSQLWCFLISLAFAALFNIDSVHLFSTLWQHPALVSGVAMTGASQDTAAALEGLQTLPIGWIETSPKLHSYSPFVDKGVFVQFLGWLITATAALFGAPFWFDLLQQVIRIRGTGPKPNPLPTTLPGSAKSAPMPRPSSASITVERNAIVDLHADRHKDDESYRPVQAGERW